MANANGWGDGASNNNIGWGQGADNAIGWGSVYSVSEAGATDIVGTPAVDPNAQAFITAAAITDPTQQSAINQLVVDLKGYSIWTKFKALYPFVGGTNSQHAWNLKDTTTYKITWYGGVTSSANGILGNGTNGYGDTFLANNVMAQSNAHISVYSRTNYQGTVSDIASYSNQFGSFMYIRGGGNNFEGQVNAGTRVNVSNTDSRGLFLITRTSAISQTGQKNTTQYVTASVPTNHIASSFKLLRTGDASAEYSPRNLAFASIGDGLTDAEALNFYTAVQAFQTTIGRSIGTQTVSDADAQAFVTAADIQDQVEANAVNNLVIGLKADSLWTKFKALYPFVGGTAAQHKWNLKDPRDLDAAFRLVFNGGWTHSSTGALPNGTNAYADTKYIENVNGNLNSTHLSYYSRTNSNGTEVEIGARSSVTNVDYNLLEIRTSGTTYFLSNQSGFTSVSDANSQGFYITNRQASNDIDGWKNGSKLVNGTTVSTIRPNVNTMIGAMGTGSTPLYFSTKQTAFASIGDGLTDTEAANFYTRVQNFNTALARQV
jgi:hypothetical protein